MKKRLLLIVPMLHQGGFEKVCIRTARLLQTHCEVTILIFDDADIAYDIEGLNVISIQVGSRKGLLAKFVNILKRVKKVRQIKKELAIDYAYSFGITANLINVLTKNQGKVWIGLRGFTDLQASVHSLLCRRADRILCCSLEITNLIRQHYPRKLVHCIYNPYDIEDIARSSMQELSEEEKLLYGEKKIILSMGREDVVKGFWHLIRCFYHIHQQDQNTLLVIVGEGNYTVEREFARNLGISESVIFTGVKSNPFPLLKRAAVYALTSLNEGFPNALVEAMALGIPVVATNCRSGPAEILAGKTTSEMDELITERIYAEYGILTARLSSMMDTVSVQLEPEEEIFRNSLMDLLTEGDLSKNYQNKGPERASYYSDEKYISQILKIME